MAVREPAVAGLFYPDDARALEREVSAQLALAARRPLDDVHALIAPHAGYVYSGPIAASAYAVVPGERFHRTVLLGPSHRVAFSGLALSAATCFATPLGPVQVDPILTRRAARLSCVQVLDQAHALEHSLEVHLPFIQITLPGATVLPVVVGDASPQEVESLLSATWDKDTLLVVSTDLSHFLDYETALEVDADTTRRIEALATDLRPEQACGCRPLNGLLRYAAARGLAVTALDVRNSGDTAGTREQVVGYGAYLAA